MPPLYFAGCSFIGQARAHLPQEIHFSVTVIGDGCFLRREIKAAALPIGQKEHQALSFQIKLKTIPTSVVTTIMR